MRPLDVDAVQAQAREEAGTAGGGGVSLLTRRSRKCAAAGLTALLPLVLAAVAAAQEADCPPGRYVVLGQHLIDGGTPPANDSLTIGGVEAWVGSGACASGRFRRKTKRGRTLLTARFRRCLYVRKAVVKARHADCDTLEGTVTSRHNQPRRRSFRAVRIPSFAPPADAAVVGEAGGLHEHASGARLVVPAGAVAAGTTARVALTPVPLALWQQVVRTLGILPPEDLVPLRAFQVFVEPADTPLRSALAIAVPDGGSSVAGSLLHALVQPTFVDHQSDPRPVAFVYGGPAERGDGTFETTLAASDAGPPPGLGAVMAIRPGVRTCTVTGTIATPSTTPVGGVLVTSAGFPGLAARTTASGFYRLLVREGTHALAASDGRASVYAETTCDPDVEPVVDGIHLVLGDQVDPNVPRITIVDPAGDERLETSVRSIVGTVETSLVRSVRIETHAAGLPTPLAAEVPVSGHQFAGTAHLIPGRRNTVIVTGSDGRRLGSDRRVLEVTPPGEADFPLAVERATGRRP